MERMAEITNNQLAEKIDLFAGRFGVFEGRFGTLEGKFVALESRFGAFFEDRLSAFENKVDQRFDETDRRFDLLATATQQEFTILRGEMAGMEAAIATKAEFREAENRLLRIIEKIDMHLSSYISQWNDDFAELDGRVALLEKNRGTRGMFPVV